MKKFAGSAAPYLSLLLTLSMTPFSFGQDLPAGTGRETLKRVCTHQVPYHA